MRLPARDGVYSLVQHGSSAHNLNASQNRLETIQLHVLSLKANWRENLNLRTFSRNGVVPHCHRPDRQRPQNGVHAGSPSGQRDIRVNTDLCVHPYGD